MSLRRVFYGWWILATLVFLTAIAGGLTFMSFTFYITPMEHDFGWSRTETSIAAVVTMVSFALAAPSSGWWMDRHSIRMAMVGGTVATALGFVLLHFTRSLLMFYAGWAIVAFARTWIVFVPANILASRWFRRRRGLALGVVTSGPALGSIAVIPVLTRLIDAYGWDGAYLISAIALPVVFLPLTLLVIRDAPEQSGLVPDGSPGPVVDSAESRPHEMEETYTLRQALRTRAYWMVTAASLCFWLGSDSFQPHQAPFFESQGYTQDDAARFIQLASVVQLFGRGGLIVFIDRIHRVRLVSAASSACFAVAIGVLVVNSGLPGVAVFVLFYGMGWSAGAMLQPLLLSRYFGTAALGALMGLMEVLNFGGIFIGPVLAGAIYDSSGTYRPALILFSGAIAVASVLFAVALPPRRRLPPPATARGDRAVAASA